MNPTHNEEYYLTTAPTSFVLDGADRTVFFLRDDEPEALDALRKMLDEKHAVVYSEVA